MRKATRACGIWSIAHGFPFCYILFHVVSHKCIYVHVAGVTNIIHRQISVPWKFFWLDFFFLKRRNYNNFANDFLSFCSFSFLFLFLCFIVLNLLYTIKKIKKKNFKFYLFFSFFSTLKKLTELYARWLTCFPKWLNYDLWFFILSFFVMLTTQAIYRLAPATCVPRSSGVYTLQNRTLHLTYLSVYSIRLNVYQIFLS